MQEGARTIKLINENKKKPFFLVTIDIEGDNLWERPRKVTTKNASFLHRFQKLCESYNLRPTYLTNYGMTMSPDFREYGKSVLKRGVGEIGMHLYAWTISPDYKLTEDDFRFHPYLIEYPENIMGEQNVFLTDLLEETFGVKMVIHRAGRWAIISII